MFKLMVRLIWMSEIQTTKSKQTRASLNRGILQSNNDTPRRVTPTKLSAACLMC